MPWVRVCLNEICLLKIVLFDDECTHDVYKNVYTSVRLLFERSDVTVAIRPKRSHNETEDIKQLY